MPGTRLHRIWAMLVGALLLLLVALILVRGSKSVYNDMRLAPTFGLMEHLVVYQDGVEGPLFCVLYAPLSYLFYSPAFFWRTPFAVFLSGSSLALLYYSLPLIPLTVRLRRQQGEDGTRTALVAILFYAFTMHSESLRYSATLITADAPALGFAGLAVVSLVLANEARWSVALACSLFTVLSVGSKQNMLPLLFIMPVLAYLLRGWRFLLRFILGLVALGGLSLILVRILYGELSVILFNNYLVPSRIPYSWSKLPGGALGLYSQVQLLLFALGAIIILAGRKQGLAVQRSIGLHMGPFAFAAVALVPSSLLGFAVEGGASNAFAPALYFALLAMVAALYGAVRDRLRQDEVAAVVLLFCTVLVPVLARNFHPFSLKQVFRVSSSETVFRFARRHPGRVYFPSNQTSVFLAEGSFYHSDWGVGNLVLAGAPVSEQDVRKHVPARAEYLAYPPDAAGDWLLGYLAPNRRRHALDGLPGFDIYEIER